MTEPTALPITLFSTCKPFQGEIGAMQHNALNSWKQLNLPILLFGDETGVADAAKQIGARHIPAIERSNAGHPLVSALFQGAKNVSDTEYLVYSNADIILRADFLTVFAAAITQVRNPTKLFLTGHRQHIPLSRRLDAQQLNDRTIADLISQFGCWDNANAIDLFVFHRSLLNDLPPLTVGRMQWDNWLLWKAVQEGATIVDASAMMTLAHPIHGYAAGSSSWREYTQDDDAKNNRELCAGRLLTLEQAATHTLIDGRLLERTATPVKTDWQPDRHKLLAAGLIHLLEGFDQRPLAETIDCLRNLLWNNNTWFPMDSTEQYDVDNVLEQLKIANFTLAKGDFQGSINILQDLLTVRFLQTLANKQQTMRPLYIWGCGQLGQRLHSLLSRKDLDFRGYLDSDRTRLGKIVSGKPVLANNWHDAVAAGGNRPFIIIASMYYREITETLLASGLENTIDFVA